MTTELTPMQTELLKRSDAIMESLGKTISSAVDFSKEQIPDIAYQYIAFERAYSSIALLVGICLVFLSYTLIKKAINIPYDRYDANDKPEVMRKSGWLVGITGAFIVMLYTKAFFLVWFAPKVFLLQSLTSLIKG